MQAVIETPTFLADLRNAGVTDSIRWEIIEAVSREPRAGDLIPGTGGARKRRIAGRGKGKSGGYRIIAFCPGEDVPVFLLAMLSKGERADLSQAERNELRAILANLAQDYRSGVTKNVTRMRRQSR